MTGINHESAMRVSDADRNGTLRRLHNAVALGLIDIDEFEERSALVSQARLHSDLDALVFDLPGPGAVVTSAGLVFAFTMISMGASALVILGQFGTTVGMGLLFDTLVVRSFMTPAIASLLGLWFWWLQLVRARPLRTAPAPQSQPQHELATVPT